MSVGPLFAKELSFETFLTRTRADLTTVTSNHQAETFIQLTMGPFRPASPTPHVRARKQKKTQLPKSLTKHMVELATGMAIWHQVVALKKWLNHEHNTLFPILHSENRDHFDWAKQESNDPEFLRVLALAEAFDELHQTKETTIAEWSHYADYTQYLHENFPFESEGIPPLLEISQKEGASGVQRRLQEFWDAKTFHDGEDLDPSRRTRIRQSYASRYLHHHYLPLHKAYLQAALIKLQMDVERRTRSAWNELRQWQSDQNDQKGLFRLCGTWNWLIHNHQNHGDHKTIMTYPPPSQYDRMDPKPATIHVLGDTVYIRWEFPRGIVQEESLLFSEKDQLLTGTFINNLGPNGNITGRRIKPCQHQ